MSDTNGDRIEPDDVGEDDEVPPERTRSRCRRMQRRRELRDQLGLNEP